MTRDLHDVVLVITGTRSRDVPMLATIAERMDEGALRARHQDMPAVCLTSNDAVSVRVGLVRRGHARGDVPGLTGHSRACRRYLCGVEGEHRSTQ